ncbi:MULTISPECIES: DUF6896 domain-containing protein [unclassified Paraflavitalea]|uniref:DUF6896 domain-containing protein n=1 Tax=unclassified Paraflavitalea TaxID=2798305 RepID=UPI003D3349D0
MDRLISLLHIYVSYIKIFEASLVEKYKLDDIPYNLAGKKFPKNGSLKIDNEFIEYRYHGRGCTLLWNKVKIIFKVDAASENKIIITPLSWDVFLETYMVQFPEKKYSNMNDCILEHFESIGIFTKRQTKNSSDFNVNEVWISSFNK